MLALNHNYFQVTPTNKNLKENVQPFKTRRFIFGLFVLLLVDVLWVASSELTKFIYTEKKLEKPFLVTYVRSSLLLLYLLALCFTSPRREQGPPGTPDYTQLLETNVETEDENFYSEPNNSLLQDDSTFVPVRAGETTDSDDAVPRAVRFNKVAEVRVMSAAQAGEALLARLSWAASVRASEHAQRRAATAAARRHLKLALTFCIPWFVANYLYLLSLVNTPTSSATVYTSSYSAYALTFGAVFAQAPTDRLTLTKCLAISLAAAGLVTIGVSDTYQSGWTSVLTAVGSALCYSVHLVLMRQEFRRGDALNTPLFYGLVGSLCLFLSWVVGGVLNATHVETLEWPSAAQWSWLLLDGLLGPLLGEALWLWGRSLTSSVTATASLALAAPLALCAEVWGGRMGSAARAGGAALAAAGWAAAAAGDGADTALHVVVRWLRMQCCPGDVLSSLRYIPELDEQTEALMSSEEPT